MVLYLDRIYIVGCTRCYGRASVYLCASSLQNLAVPQDVYYPLSFPVERSCWPCIRWCGTAGFQERGQYLFIGLTCSILSSTIFPFLFFLSIGGYYGAGVFGLIGCRSLSGSLALPTSFNNNNNHDNSNNNNNNLIQFCMMYDCTMHVCCIQNWL